MAARGLSTPAPQPPKECAHTLTCVCSLASFLPSWEHRGRLQAAALTDWPWENKARAGKGEDAVCAGCGTLDVCRDHKYCLCVAGEDGNKDCPLKDHNFPLRNVVINTLGQCCQCKLDVRARQQDKRDREKDQRHTISHDERKMRKTLQMAPARSPVSDPNLKRGRLSLRGQSCTVMRELFFWFCEWGFVTAFTLLPKEGGGGTLLEKPDSDKLWKHRFNALSTKRRLKAVGDTDWRPNLLRAVVTDPQQPEPHPDLLARQFDLLARERTPTPTQTGGCQGCTRCTRTRPRSRWTGWQQPAAQHGAS